jgi:hypothetical protein
MRNTHSTIKAEPTRESDETNPTIECCETNTQMMKDTPLVKTLSHCTDFKLPLSSRVPHARTRKTSRIPSTGSNRAAATEVR